MAGQINFGITQPELSNALAAGYYGQEATRNKLQSQQIQNQVADLELKNALAEQEAYKQAAQGGNVQQALMERGLGKQAGAYSKLMAETQKAGLEGKKLQNEDLMQTFSNLAFNPSNENIIAHLQDKIKTGVISPQEAQGYYQQFTSLPIDQRPKMFTMMSMTAEKRLATELRQQEADTSRQRLQFEMNPAQQAGIAQAKATGTETGKSTAKAAANLPGAIESAERGIKLIDEMIGDTTVNEKGQIVYGKKKPHGGFSSYVGATWLPGQRFLEGTDTASFELRQKQIEGQAFLDAFETLKGGGQITEKEGEKATAAISRMNKASSEVEYIKAARELQEVLRSGVKKAKTRATSGGAGAPLPKNKWASALAEFEAQENQ